MRDGAPHPSHGDVARGTVVEQDAGALRPPHLRSDVQACGGGLRHRRATGSARARAGEMA